MLTMQFRNLIITAENHENLLQEDIDKIMAALNQVFDKAELNLKNNPPGEICYCVTRLSRTDKLVVAFNPDALHNPYLFVIDKTGKTLSNQVAFEKLLGLRNEIVVAELDANVKSIAADRFKCIQTVELSESIKRMSKGR